MNTQELKLLRDTAEHDEDCGTSITCDPTAILCLINTLSAAERERDELREQFDKLASAAGWSKEQCEQVGESPFDAVEDLVSAKRERDELRAEQAEHDEQIARMESKFSLAKRALDSKTARCEKAETELRRRDAAAGEPVAYIIKGRYDKENGRDRGRLNWHGLSDRNAEDIAYYNLSATPLYAAAHPAMFPELEQDVKNIIGLLSGNEWAEHCTKSELGRKLENEITELHNTYSRAPAVLPPAVMKHLSDAANTVSEWTHGDEHSCKVSRTSLIAAIEALGAQQQKVVELPTPYDIGKGDRRYYDITGWHFDREELIAALDAAGVKWEVMVGDIPAIILGIGMLIGIALCLKEM